jgi:hypothetical protein
MKVLMTQGFLPTRSHTSKPCVSIRERAGTRLTSMPVLPGGIGRRKRCQTFFRFTYFHGPSAARPLGWPLRMTNGKVHIPSDLVVDPWVSNVESSSPRDVLLLHDLWTTVRHLLWSHITSAISMAWDFTTKSGGICLVQLCKVFLVCH